MKRFADMEDEYFAVFVERLVYMCGVIAGYILTGNMESKEERLNISSLDFDDDFCMDVYGVYPTHFLNDGILIVGVVRGGEISVGDFTCLPYRWKGNDYGIANEAMLCSVGEVVGLSMFGQNINEVKAGDVCVMSVSFNGEIPYGIDYPFHIYNTGPVADIRTASKEMREKEYADEYLAFQSWDNTSLELSGSDLQYLDSVRTTLGISEKRAKEIERLYPFTFVRNISGVFLTRLRNA